MVFKQGRSWEEYGITKERYHELKQLCESFKYDTIVIECATETDDFLWEYLYKSVTGGKSYDRLECEMGLIPCGRTDFYGYRRYFYYLLNEKLHNLVQNRKKNRIKL